MVTPLPELGRFAEPALLILVSLSDGPKHGYAIMADVEAGTGKPLGPGTLYAALARLTSSPSSRSSAFAGSAGRPASRRSSLDHPAASPLPGALERPLRR